MSRPRHHPSTLAVIARSYIAGTPCAELAKIHGISKADVVNITHKWRVEQSRKIAKEAFRQKIVAPPMETPDPGCEMVPVIYGGRPIISVVKRVYNPRNCKDHEFHISLPYYAIQGTR